MQIISKSLKETEDFAKNFLQNLKQAKDKALVVGLYGNLGSGKTTFVQFVAEALGIKENITSPTFVIEKIYKVENRDWLRRLIHIDAYRLQKGEELKTLGFNEILNDSENLIMIEWPENVFDALPKDILKLEFEFIDENTRKINLKALNWLSNP